MRGPVLQIEFRVHLGNLEDAGSRVAARQRRNTAELIPSQANGVRRGHSGGIGSAYGIHIDAPEDRFRRGFNENFLDCRNHSGLAKRFQTDRVPSLAEHVFEMSVGNRKGLIAELVELSRLQEPLLEQHAVRSSTVWRRVV